MLSVLLLRPYFRILRVPMMLQVRDHNTDIPVVHVAVADELHYRARPDDACWSLCFVLLGV